MSTSRQPQHNAAKIAGMSSAAPDLLVSENNPYKEAQKSQFGEYLTHI